MIQSVILIDAFTGGNLCKFSLPSQFQISGFRYYGIGNEYAGILIAMAALLSTFSSRNTRPWLTMILGVIIILALGLGRVGANYGGTITAAVTFGLMAVSIKREKFGFRHIAAAFFVGIAALAALSIIDYRIFGSTAAHAGRMASLVQRVGGDYVISLIVRKMLLNLHIIVRPEAIIAYAVLIPSFLFWVYKVPRKLKDEIFADRSVAACIKALLVGMITALLFNDSGIVMALLMFGMLACLMLYFIIESIGAKGEAI